MDIDASTSTVELYRDTSNSKLYTDATLETSFNATVDNAQVQVKALNENTVTYGTNEFIKFTAGDLNVEDSNGKQLIMDSTDNTVYMVTDGTPESTNMQVVDVNPEDTTTETTGTTDTTEVTENTENP